MPNQRCGGARPTTVRRGTAGDRRLRRPQVALHAGPRSGGRRARRGGRRGSSDYRRRRPDAPAGRPGARLRPPRGLERDLGQAGPLGAGEMERVRMHPTSPSGCCGSRRRSPRSARSPSSTGSASTVRLSARPRRARDLAAGPAPRRGRRLPGHAGAPAAPRALGRGRGRGASCAPRSRPGGWTATRSRPCSRRPGTESARRRDRPAGLTAREVEVLAPGRAGADEQGDRRALFISRKTAGNHVEHIYTKIGASTRDRGRPCSPPSTGSSARRSPCRNDLVLRRTASPRRCAG